jgi:hypothetical protein
MTNLIAIGTKVTYRHSSVSERPAKVVEHRVNMAHGRIWSANSYYVLRTDDGATHVVDLVDAHLTGGGMVIPSA